MAGQKFSPAEAKHLHKRQKNLLNHSHSATDEDFSGRRYNNN